MPLAIAISNFFEFLPKLLFLFFSLGSLEPLIPHATAISNFFFLNFHKNCCFHHFQFVC